MLRHADRARYTGNAGDNGGETFSSGYGSEAVWIVEVNPHHRT